MIYGLEMAFDIVMSEPIKILFAVMMVLILAVVLIKFASNLSDVAQTGVDMITRMVKNAFEFT